MEMSLNNLISKRILIVEDEAVIAMELQSYLVELGYKTIASVNTGEKAIQHVVKDEPDLILMDIRIKGELDGIQTAAIIRKQHQVPIVFSTAYLDQKEIEKAKFTMPFGYVLKPYRRKDLKVTIEMALYLSTADKKRQEAELALKKSEERYRAISELTSDYSYSYRVEKDGSLTNEWLAGSVEELTGYSHNELNLQGGWEKLIHPDDLHIAYDQLKAILNNKPKRVEYRTIGKSGRIKWLEDFGRPVWSETQNRVVKIEGAAKDITDRKINELKLKESEAKHRTLFMSMRLGVVYQDHKGRIIDANPAAEKILGLTLDQMTGRTSMDSRWKAIKRDRTDCPGDQHPAMLALKDGKPVYNFIMGVTHAEQEETRWIKIDSVPKFRNGEQQPYEVYSLFEDVTNLLDENGALKLDDA